MPFKVGDKVRIVGCGVHYNGCATLTRQIGCSGVVIRDRGDDVDERFRVAVQNFPDHIWLWRECDLQPNDRFQPGSRVTDGTAQYEVISCEDGMVRLDDGDGEFCLREDELTPVETSDVNTD